MFSYIKIVSCLFTLIIQLSAVCLLFLAMRLFVAIFNHCAIYCQHQSCLPKLKFNNFGYFWYFRFLLKKALHDLDASVFAFLDLRLCLRVDFTLKLAFDMKRSLVVRLTYKPFSLWIWMKVVSNLPFLVYHPQCLKFFKNVSYYNIGSINVNK